MFPAAEESTAGIVIVAAVFSIVTILTMLFMVLLPLMGLKMLPMKFLERYMHAIAGFTILICGIGIEFLGL
jgi:threonine/homoserine/homoserine lactone efflux protein